MRGSCSACFAQKSWLAILEDGKKALLQVHFKTTERWGFILNNYNLGGIGLFFFLTKTGETTPNKNFAKQGRLTGAVLQVEQWLSGRCTIH